MSKRMIGVSAGLAVASVAALATPLGSAVAATPTALAATTVAAATSLVVPSSAPAAPAAPGTPAASGAAEVTAAAQVAPAPAAPAVRAATSSAVTATTVMPKATTVAKPKPKPVPPPPVYKLVRKVQLQMPTTAMVGANVNGFVQVLDDNGQVQSPVPGAHVQFQRKDGGRWTPLSDDVTDENGLLPVAFSSQTNMTVRAAYLPRKGATVYSATVAFSAPSQVTWAARPDMEVAAKTALSYAFRVNAGFVPNGHLEFTSADKPGKWTSGPTARVESTGVVNAKVTFPAPGTYLLRGTTGKSPTNAPGYTSSITVLVE